MNDHDVIAAPAPVSRAAIEVRNQLARYGMRTTDDDATAIAAILAEATQPGTPQPG